MQTGGRSMGVFFRLNADGFGGMDGWSGLQQFGAAVLNHSAALGAAGFHVKLQTETPPDEEALVDTVPSPRQMPRSGRQIERIAVPVEDDDRIGKRRFLPQALINYFDRHPANFLHPIGVNTRPMGMRQKLSAQADTHHWDLPPRLLGEKLPLPSKPRIFLVFIDVHRTTQDAECFSLTGRRRVVFGGEIVVRSSDSVFSRPIENASWGFEGNMLHDVQRVDFRQFHIEDRTGVNNAPGKLCNPSISLACHNCCQARPKRERVNGAWRAAA
jgi:hypothetical protein